MNTYQLDGYPVSDRLLLKKAAHIDLDFEVDFWTKHASEAAQVLRDHGHTVIFIAIQKTRDGINRRYHHE